MVRYTPQAMSVDGALNVTGISLEMLGVATGVIASPAGERVRKRLAALGAKMKESYSLILFLGLFFIISGMAGLIIGDRLLPSDWWIGWLLVIAVGFIGAVVSESDFISWTLDWLPEDEREVAVFLGLAGGIFGVGLILQLIAAATP